MMPSAASAMCPSRTSRRRKELYRRGNLAVERQADERPRRECGERTSRQPNCQFRTCGGPFMCQVRAGTRLVS